MKNQMNIIKNLINILLYDQGLFEDRHDAAMELGHYIDSNAINALIKVASRDIKDPNLDEQIIVEACGESLAKIWIAQNKFDKQTFAKLNPYAKDEAQSYIRSQKPEWIEQFETA